MAFIYSFIKSSIPFSIVKYTEDGVQRSLKVTLWRQSRNNVGMTNEIDINVFYKT